MGPRVTLGERVDHDGLTQVFDEVLETPSRTLTVSTVHDDTLLELRLATERTRVRIWVNAAQEPDDIRVVATPFLS